MSEDKQYLEEDLQDGQEEAKWYAIHTYSGHENKVKINLESMVKNRELEDLIQDVQVPTEEIVEEKDGMVKVKERKLFPSYVLVKMIMNDRTWYIVRNTRGVTGFVGPGAKPVPLAEEEVISLGVASKEEVFDEFEQGDSVKILKGPFEGFVGTVDSLNFEKGKVKVLVSMFGRDTLVELNFNQLVKI
ncbi:MAG: transcription termination/antitermination protein NusG [Tissierellia bacterium]|nr:transcription termination/antitermination protein NusG [Tissierellia bacterium]